ncbi:hypothetical protein E3_1030 [Rhodococcus phage E3]|uniref:hypothetical protein n=1 Tax=Rhodococcus phage E3 TaxID=1007869 RepID=UPI0002C6977A|nr:hypothetical protein M176_gp108 [Rhodococcus phage E3]AEQ21017.1 hypothetical protein E3_1030 [Rhodococcus phage E3]
MSTNITPGTKIHDLPVTVVSVEPANPKFGEPSKLITLETEDGQRLLWFRKRPAKLARGNKIVLAEAYAKAQHVLGTVVTQISLEDNAPLKV